MMASAKHPVPSARCLVRRHPLASFVLLAYGLSWTAWAPLVLRDAHVVTGGSVSQFPGLVGPALAALMAGCFGQGRPGVLGLLPSAVRAPASPGRIVVYGVSPVGFLALALGISHVMGQTSPQARQFALYPGLPLLPLPVVVLAVLVMNGFGEEIGWRGFALARFQNRFGPILGTLLLGATWAAWHALSVG